MRVLFFCENANQVHLCSKLAESVAFPPFAEYQFICMDWEAETAMWVSRALASIDPKLTVINLFDEASLSLQNLLRSEKKNRKPFLEDVAFEFFRPEIGKKDVVVVQFNDASQRGQSIAKVCRNTGIARLLIQDGFLNFVSKTSSLKLTDQNYKWGHTQPEMISVWGEEMKKAIIDRHQNNPQTIHVTGNFRKELNIPDHATFVARDRPIRVLWADQAILDQNKANRQNWLLEYASIADALKEFDTDLRLHPSTKEVNRAALQTAIGETLIAASPARPSITAEEIREFDVVVTYYSTVFLDCLAHNIPCVIFRTKALDIELPSIDHPLLKYCNDVSDLANMVRTAARSTIDSPVPADIRRYLSNNNGAEHTAQILAGFAENSGSKPELSKRPPDVEVLANIKRLQSEQILVLGGSFGDHIGVGKPIKIFIDYLRGRSVDIQYQLVTNGDKLNLLSRVSQTSIVIINSFDVVRAMTERDMAALLDIVKIKGGSVVFYCHETKHAFERLLRMHGGKVQAFVNNVLPFCHCLAVSDQQADWLGSLGARSVRTVYNSSGSEFSYMSPRQLSTSPIILMVGTQQKRKGVDLFSRVADIAVREGKEWKFVWLGAYTRAAEECYKSSNVDWKGHVSSVEVRDWLSKASVFFLSSIDDPMPLSVGEALMNNVPSLVYGDTGFASFIEAYGAGEVFRDYDADTAYSKLLSMINNGSIYSVDRGRVEQIIGVEQFGKRMLIALGEIAVGHSPKFSKAVSGDVALHRIMKKSSAVKNKTRKMRFLNYLERVLPSFIVNPGEKILRILKLI